MKKRIWTMLLAVICLIPLACLLTACGGGNRSCDITYQTQGVEVGDICKGYGFDRPGTDWADVGTDYTITVWIGRMWPNEGLKITVDGVDVTSKGAFHYSNGQGGSSGLITTNTYDLTRDRLWMYKFKVSADHAVVLDATNCEERGYTVTLNATTFPANTQYAFVKDSDQMVTPDNFLNSLVAAPQVVTNHKIELPVQNYGMFLLMNTADSKDIIVENPAATLDDLYQSSNYSSVRAEYLGQVFTYAGKNVYFINTRTAGDNFTLYAYDYANLSAGEADTHLPNTVKINFNKDDYRAFSIGGLTSRTDYNNTSYSDQRYVVGNTIYQRVDNYSSDFMPMYIGPAAKFEDDPLLANYLMGSKYIEKDVVHFNMCVDTSKGITLADIEICLVDTKDRTKKVVIDHNHLVNAQLQYFERDDGTWHSFDNGNYYLLTLNKSDVATMINTTDGDSYGEVDLVMAIKDEVLTQKFVRIEIDANGPVALQDQPVQTDPNATPAAHSYICYDYVASTGNYILRTKLTDTEHYHYYLQVGQSLTDVNCVDFESKKYKHGAWASIPRYATVFVKIYDQNNQPLWAMATPYTFQTEGEDNDWNYLDNIGLPNIPNDLTVLRLSVVFTFHEKDSSEHKIYFGNIGNQTAYFSKNPNASGNQWIEAGNLNRYFYVKAGDVVYYAGDYDWNLYCKYDYDHDLDRFDLLGIMGSDNVRGAWRDLRGEFGKVQIAGQEKEVYYFVVTPEWLQEGESLIVAR